MGLTYFINGPCQACTGDGLRRIPGFFRDHIATTCSYSAGFTYDTACRSCGGAGTQTIRIYGEESYLDGERLPKRPTKETEV